MRIQLQMHSMVAGAELSSQQMVLSWCLLLVIVAILLDTFCTDQQTDLQWSWMSKVGFRVLFCQEGFSPQRQGQVELSDSSVSHMIHHV